MTDRRDRALCAISGASAYVGAFAIGYVAFTGAASGTMLPITAALGLSLAIALVAAGTVVIGWAVQ